MLSSARHTDVVVVGAGTAGLSVAHRLTGAGLTVTVLEAASRTGGRMATEVVDGFRLDRVGQLLGASAPELHGTPGLEGLTLRPFSSGVLVHHDGRYVRTMEPAHVRGVRGTGPGGSHALWGVGGALTVARALASAPRSLDQARLGAALARLAATPVPRLLARPERTALDALNARLPARTVQGFLRPLLAALLGDPDLSTSSRCADLALRAFARGGLCVPAGGAATVPELLEAELPPGTVRTGVRVTEASISRVTTADHGVFRCRAVVLATGGRAAAELLPGLWVPDFRTVTVLHHTAPAPPPLAERALLLESDPGGPVAHTAVMSAVDPSRAPAGKVLVSSTVLGPPPDDLERRVRKHLAALYTCSTDDWELLGLHHDPEAIPAMPPPHDPQRTVRILSGLYVCGDHRTTGTPQAALASARRAARALLNDFGIRENHRSEEAAPVAA